MTQENKELLLKDICSRLPYKQVCLYKESLYEILGCLFNKVNIAKPILISEIKWVDIEDCKPCLRPMSSMTEEECDIVEEILGDKCIFDFMANGDIVLKQGQFSQNKLAKLYDYYNSIHVDYRGLILMGLAIEAPEGMYNITK